MKLLLDTHIFIWWSSEPDRLSPKVLTLCEDIKNSLVLSVASVWEMQIKLQLGKLKLQLPLQELIESQQQTNNMQILPIGLEHVLELHNLPSHHNDPFDRMLIAQANVESAYLVSKDEIFGKYEVNLLW
ncbi:MAG: type II toxin-antitoxin system VapC family toxin [bacterium]